MIMNGEHRGTGAGTGVGRRKNATKSYAHWIITRSGNGPVKIENDTKLGILERFI